MFLKAFYYFLRGLIWVTFRIYFRKIVNSDPKAMKLRGPYLLVSNHPNTLLDPLMEVIFIREQVFLVANYGLFKNPVTNFLLTRLYCIPVQRALDVGDGVRLNNEDSFKKCDEHLAKGGNIFIAPEGTSWLERQIHECKTGAARIALSAVSKYDIPLKILPVGLTYSAPKEFRSAALLCPGETINAADYLETYRNDPREAVRLLTEVIKARLENLTINCRDIPEDEFLKKIETVVQTEEPLEIEPAFHRSRSILEKIRAWEADDAGAFGAFKARLEDYLLQLESLHLTDAAVDAGQRERDTPTPLLLVLGFPVFLFGAATNGAQAFIANWLVKKMNVFEGYTSTIKYVSSLVLLPLFYFLEIRLFAHYIHSRPAAWIFALALIPSGLFAWDWLQRFQSLAQVSRFRLWKKRNRQAAGRLLQERNQILTAFDKHGFLTFQPAFNSADPERGLM